MGDALKCIFLFALIVIGLIIYVNLAIDKKSECDSGVTSACIEYNTIINGHRR